MDEQTISAEEKLKRLNEERKELKDQVKDERKRKLEEAVKMRTERDTELERIQEKLKTIQRSLYQYNKLGKVEKAGLDILKIISDDTGVVDKDGECQHCDGEGCDACSATETAN